MLFNSILLFILSNSLAIELKPDCKNYKQTKYDSFVCVCSEAEPCDRIEAPVKTAQGVVTIWESGRDGARLRKQNVHFNNSLVDREISNTKVNLASLNVKVNRDVKHQEIFGFGGAFTDSTGYNVQKLGPKLGEQVLKDYFSADGLEYNVGRIPIGGTDSSLRGYEYDDNGEDKTLEKFNLTQEDFDYKIPIIQKAKSMATHEIRLFGSPWSAPKWMKTNNNITHGGSIKGQVGSEYWQIYAKYLIKYLNAYKAQNITHWGLTVQNEPYAVQKFNSMYYTPEMMRDFLANTLGPELERSGYGVDKLKVMIWDHNLDHVQEWIKVIFSDPVASKYADGTAIHWYLHSPQTMLDQPHKEHPDKFILATEACVEGAPKLGDWTLAERYAADIIADLLHHTIGWTDWNMAVDEQGGPNWVNNFVDAPVIINPENHEYYRQPSFYAMAHFSKFLPPGSFRVETTVVAQIGNIAAVSAFRTTKDSTVVIVVNNEDMEIELTVEDSKVGKLVTKVEPKSIRTYVYFD